MNRMMRLFVAFVFLGFAMPAQAAHRPAVDGDKAAIRHVIQSQLDAFQKDDGVTAFRFSTPGLRARFQDSAHFMRMVRENYRPVYRPSQISFGALDSVDTNTRVQHMLVVGSDGNTHEALFVMEHQKDGKWLIAGCFLMESDLTAT
ncbi:MAG TPA: DUF4864 domain-containing protein [Stellaceae bacterium]|jgi:hypothetical protein|nr:DUF4864 domain-containing protein [Stellaceae bacterium]